MSIEFDADPLFTVGQLAGLVALGGFLASFLFIRTSARLMRSPKVPWWPGSVTSGELHVHHLVFGIVLVLLAGFVGLVVGHREPWLEIIAAAFGIGAGLTLDEFALWLHLDDVYWAEEGRRSVDAGIVAAIIAAMVVLGAVPTGGEDGSMSAIAIAMAINIVFALLTILKGKVKLGALAFFFLPAGIAGTIRLAKPRSPWARRRYAEGSRKLARATERAARVNARRNRWFDRIAGAPHILPAGTEAEHAGERATPAADGEPSQPSHAAGGARPGGPPAS